jgi:hypothetical protein
MMVMAMCGAFKVLIFLSIFSFFCTSFGSVFCCPVTGSSEGILSDRPLKNVF